MKPVRPKEEVDKIKESILISSLDIIVSDGFSALTMRRLGREIGMTAPNIYNYFANKDEIYLTLMTQGFERLLSAMKAEIDAYSQPLKRARAVMSVYLKFGIEHKSYYEIMFSSSTPKYRDYIGTEYEGMSSKEHDVSMQLAKLALSVINGIAQDKDRVLKDSEATLILTTLWSLLHGMVSLHNSQNMSYLIDDAGELYTKIIDQVMMQIERLF